MKKMKKRISMLVAIALMLCVFLSGCGSSDADPTTSDAADGSDAGYKIGYITSDPSDGFWKEVLESFTAACEEQGVEMVYQIAKDSAGHAFRL